MPSSSLLHLIISPSLPFPNSSTSRNFSSLPFITALTYLLSFCQCISSFPSTSLLLLLLLPSIDTSLHLPHLLILTFPLPILTCPLSLLLFHMSSSCILLLPSCFLPSPLIFLSQLFALLFYPCFSSPLLFCYVTLPFAYISRL